MVTTSRHDRALVEPARRGDYLLIEHRLSWRYMYGDEVDIPTYRLRRVTGVTRDGMATTVADPGGNRERVLRGAARWLVPATQVRAVELAAALAERPESDFESVKQAKAFVDQFRRED